MKKRFRRLKHYLIPHAGNKFKPAIFAKESVAVLVLALFLVEGVYFLDTQTFLAHGGFTASVLPAALTGLTNKDRAAAGYKELTHDPLLAQAAQNKAEDMAAKGYFAHISPEGKTPWYWLGAVGYEYSYAGENLAVDFTDSIDVEQGWMNSPAHHANIVKPEYTQIGIGTAQGTYQGKETTFVVEFFAAVPNSQKVPTVPKSVAVQKVTAPPESSQGSQVLGAQVESTPKPIAKETTQPTAARGTTFATVASSPNHLVTWIFSGFAVLVVALLGLATFAKKKVHYIEAAGGAVLIGVALSLVFFNGTGSSDIRLPPDGQAASVSLAL